MNGKSSRNLGLASCLLAVIVVSSACLARAQDGAASRAGQVLDNAGRGVRRGVQGAFARTRASVHDQEIISRVYSRLHWDKALVGSTLELEVRDGGTAVLSGAVADEAAKARAIELARETVGVTLVVDELTVLPPSRVIPAAPVSTRPGTRTIITNP